MLKHIYKHKHGHTNRNTHTPGTEDNAMEFKGKFFHRCTVEMFRVMDMVVENGDKRNERRNHTLRNKQARQLGSIN